MIGLPASGKSTIAQIIAGEHGAMVLDSDFAKRKLPEYDGYPWGAFVVHDESSDIIANFDSDRHFKCLFDKAVDEGYNLVIPKVGADYHDILRLHDRLKQSNYSVHLTLVSLSKEKATLRALARYKNTDRYIPLALIFDVYGERPVLTYFLLKDKYRTVFSSFGIISTDVNLGQAPICTDLWADNPASMFALKTDSLF